MPTVFPQMAAHMKCQTWLHTTQLILHGLWNIHRLCTLGFFLLRSSFRAIPLDLLRLHDRRGLLEWILNRHIGTDLGGMVDEQKDVEKSRNWVSMSETVLDVQAS
jgi:hypothetical protein